MRYWVIKGNPRQNDWDRMLRPGTTELWHAYRIPNGLKDGDRIFFWESAPKARVIALGEIVESSLVEKTKNGDSLYRVRYLTKRLDWMPDIHLLRLIPDLQKASFLKSGAAAAIFPLTETQAVTLYRLLSRKNAVHRLWEDIPSEVSIPDIDLAVREGDVRLIAHLRHERDRGIVENKKSDFLLKYGRLFCECCGFDFVLSYGMIAEGLCEVHHRRPLALAEQPVITSLDDLAVLCSNCHRVIHRFDPMITVDELSRIVKRAGKLSAEGLEPRTIPV